MPPYTVLVVDDDPAVRLLLDMLIEQDPRLVLAGAAREGREAVQRVRDRCPDAIICDIRMPVMDGLQALPLLRTACPSSVIVLYSSAPQEATVVPGLGADAVVDKLTDPEQLLGLVVQMCHAREQD